MVHLPGSLSDHPSLVGIIRFPKCNYTTTTINIPTIVKNQFEGKEKFFTVIQEVDHATEITSEPQTSKSFSIPKNEITDFYPYTFYVLTDGESEPLILHPQYMPDNITFKYVSALSNQPIERYYPTQYKGDTTGNIYNITNLNQMMLPTATNEGINYLNANANTIAQTRKSNITSNVLNAVGVGASAVATGGLSLIGGVSSLVSGLQTIKQNDARNTDLMLTPSTITSFGTPSTRNAFNTNNVRLIKYTVTDQVKNKVNNFCKKYGNKYNNYDKIDLKTYKGYLKIAEPDFDGGIDNNYLTKIIEIFERGVTIE